MIRWKDFQLDDVCGPTLNFEGLDAIEIIVADRQRASALPLQVCREEKRSGRPDARNGDQGKTNEWQRATAQPLNIQETRQECEPARMVGFTSHDSASADRKSTATAPTSFSTQAREGERSE